MTKNYWDALVKILSSMPRFITEIALGWGDLVTFGDPENSRLQTQFALEYFLVNCRREISNIPSDDILLNISRDIHLTPDDWIDYPYSSIRSYLYDDAPCWMNKMRIAQLYGSAEKYLEFLQA